jgi:hypothetical protein
VIGDLGRRDASFSGTHHATRLRPQLMQGPLAMLTEPIPAARINGVWIRFRSWHQCGRGCPQSLGS